MRRHHFTIWLVLLGFLTISGTLMTAPPARAATTDDRRVLIVYDAINPTVSGQKKLAAVQRIFASLGIKTQSERLSDYYQGQLTTRKYRGVVTLNNWEQGRLQNRAFVRDRQAFKGIHLHIGSSLTAQEATQLGAKRVATYHQQFVLRSGQNWQLLPFSTDLTLLASFAKNTQRFGTLATQSAGLAPTRTASFIVGRATCPTSWPTAIVSRWPVRRLLHCSGRRGGTSPC